MTGDSVKRRRSRLGAILPLLGVVSILIGSNVPALSDYVAVFWIMAFACFGGTLFLVPINTRERQPPATDR